MRLFNKKNTTEINWIARDENAWDVAEKPYPAVQNLPEWFRNMKPFAEGHSTIWVENGAANLTPKKCIPMLDGLTLGYIIPLWADVVVKQVAVNGRPTTEPLISWKTHREVFQLHGEDARSVQPPEGYGTAVFKYMNRWFIQTPPGYSIFVFQPTGFMDSPFHCIPAVVDSDKSTLELVFPVWVKSGFEGVVEKGTPMIQVLPFKRDEWSSKFSYFKDGEYEKIYDKNFGGTIVNHYIKKVWSRKKFN